MNLKIVMSALTASLLLLTSCGSYEQPQQIKSGDDNQEVSADNTTETKAPEIYNIGDTIELKGNNVTLASVSEHTSDNQFSQPKDGMKYLAVEVIIENTSEAPTNYNPFDFKVFDAEGFTYDISFVGGKEPKLDSGSLQPTRKTRGFLTFEVPQESKGLELSYTPNFLNASEAIFSLNTATE